MPAAKLVIKRNAHTHKHKALALYAHNWRKSSEILDVQYLGRFTAFYSFVFFFFLLFCRFLVDCSTCSWRRVICLSVGTEKTRKTEFPKCPARAEAPITQLADAINNETVFKYSNWVF